MQGEDSIEKDPAEIDLDFTEGDQSEIQDAYEHHLEENERRLREAERLARLGHWELDHETGKLYWSGETYRILGLDPISFEPSYETFLGLIHPHDRDYVKQQYEESLEKNTQYNVYHRILLKSGVQKFVNERCRTFYDADGKPVRSLGTILDMTDHEREVENLMRAKAGLEVYARGLEAEVEHLTDQLERERKELATARELIRALGDNQESSGFERFRWGPGAGSDGQDGATDQH
jgi:PAS domain S-box-containing protein